MDEDIRETRVDLDDESALLAVADSDPETAFQGRTVLAERYFPPLVDWLTKRFHARDDIAEYAASKAVMRLFTKVQADLDAVSPENQGVWRWLKKVALDAAKDRWKWIRREQLYGIGHDPEDADPPEDLARNATPDAAAQAGEQAVDVFRVVDELPEPSRSILLFDLVGAYEELRGEARAFHDRELLSVTAEHEVYTRNALRAHRTRIRKQLGPKIHRLLGVPYDE